MTVQNKLSFFSPLGVSWKYLQVIQNLGANYYVLVWIRCLFVYSVDFFYVIFG